MDSSNHAVHLRLKIDPPQIQPPPPAITLYHMLLPFDFKPLEAIIRTIHVTCCMRHTSSSMRNRPLSTIDFYPNKLYLDISSRLSADGICLGSTCAQIPCIPGCFVLNIALFVVCVLCGGRGGAAGTTIAPQRPNTKHQLNEQGARSELLHNTILILLLFNHGSRGRSH